MLVLKNWENKFDKFCCGVCDCFGNEHSICVKCEVWSALSVNQIMKDKEVEGTCAIFVYKAFHLRNISRKEKAELETIYATY